MTDAREELITTFATNRWLAHAALFRDRHPDESAPAHEQLVRKIYDPAPRMVIEGFRGFGKSTYLEEAAVLKAAFREFRNMVIVAASYSRACDRLASIKRILDQNEELTEIFGQLRGAIWQEGKITLAGDRCIQALGRDQSMLGIKYLDWRPDAVLVDDVEDPGEARSDNERTKTWDWFLKTFLPALADPHETWVRVLGTRRGKGSLPEQLEDRGWPTVKFPVEYRHPETGERTATWPAPAKFPLWKIDEIRNTMYRGDLDTYEQEYMCRPTSDAARLFRPEMIRVEPRVRSWQPVLSMYDPARTTNATSATTGKVVGSWVGRKLVIWESSGERWLPSELIDDLFSVNRRYGPIWNGVEEDGLNEWILQPLRHEAVRRGVFCPIKPMKAPRDKDRFIGQLQHFFNAGEIEFASEQPAFREQLLSFPFGPKDIPNAAAYFLRMRPGLPVFDGFDESCVVDDLEPIDGKPLFLAGNAEGGVVTAILALRAEGELRIFADWVREGSPDELVGQIHEEAALLAETGEWVDREEWDAEQPYKLPVRRRGWLRLPIRWVVPAKHLDTWNNVGLMQAIRRIPQGVSAADGGAERGRPLIAALLAQRHRDMPRLQVSPNARWTLRALSGGYARAIGQAGIAEAQPESGFYRTLIEGLEAFCAIGQTAQATPENQQPVAYTRSGVAYRSAIPQERVR